MSGVKAVPKIATPKHLAAETVNCAFVVAKDDKKAVKIIIGISGKIESSRREKKSKHKNRVNWINICHFNGEKALLQRKSASSDRKLKNQVVN